MEAASYIIYQAIASFAGNITSEDPPLPTSNHYYLTIPKLLQPVSPPQSNSYFGPGSATSSQPTHFLGPDSADSVKFPDSWPWCRHNDSILRVCKINVFVFQRAKQTADRAMQGCPSVEILCLCRLSFLVLDGDKLQMTERRRNAQLHFNGKASDPCISHVHLLITSANMCLHDSICGHGSISRCFVNSQSCLTWVSLTSLYL